MMEATTEIISVPAQITCSVDRAPGVAMVPHLPALNDRESFAVAFTLTEI